MLSPHRQQLIDAMEAHFQSLCAPEDRMFAKHPTKTTSLSLMFCFG